MNVVINEKYPIIPTILRIAVVVNQKEMNWTIKYNGNRMNWTIKYNGNRMNWTIIIYEERLKPITNTCYFLFID